MMTMITSDHNLGITDIEHVVKLDLLVLSTPADDITVSRLIPEGMSPSELVELLSRLTVHMDEELRGLSFQSLQTLIVDFPEWRQDVMHGFTHFLAREVQVCSPQPAFFIGLGKFVYK